MNSKLFRLIPITFLIHVLEEYLLGFPEWASRHFGSITTVSFFILSHIPLIAIVIFASTIGAKGKPKSSQLVLGFIIQTVLFTNGLFHVVTSFMFDEISPGTFTSVAIYFPFSMYFYHYLVSKQQLSIRQFIIGFSIGSFISTLVILSLKMTIEA